MRKRTFLAASAIGALALAASSGVMAQANTFKIGLILPMTGPQASTGRQIEAAARLYMAQNGDTVALSNTIKMCVIFYTPLRWIRSREIRHLSRR